MKFGIAFKLACLLACISILASGVTGYYAYRASSDALLQAAKNELLTTTQVLARRLIVSRAEVSRNLTLISGHPAARAMLQRPNAVSEEALQVLFDGLLGANPAYLQVRLISAADHGLERVRLDRAHGKILRVSSDDLQEKWHFSYVSRTLELAPRETFLSRMVINHEGGSHAGRGRPSVILAMPVFGDHAKAIGVVVINVDLQNAFAMLAVDLPKHFQLFLANKTGDYLIHPDPSQAFGFDRGQRVLIQDDFPEAAELVEGKLHKAWAQAASGRYADVPVVAAFVAQDVIVSSEDERLILAIAQPLDILLAPAQQLGITLLKLLTALCLGCLVVAVIVARAVTRPINTMSQAVQRFAYEHESSNLAVNRRDEIGVLAHSFNHMQEEIRQHLLALKGSRLELEQLARLDALTGIANRRAFQDRLDQSLVRAQRNGERLALLFVDVDHFKGINDTFGHEGGDEALKVVASLLLSTIRKVDAVARMGGDEFVILLENPAHPQDVAHIAEKLLASVQSRVVYRGHTLPVSLSIGISQYPQDGANAADLMACADKAMYEVKAAGRNGFRFFTGGPPLPAPTEML